MKSLTIALLVAVSLALFINHGIENRQERDRVEQAARLVGINGLTMYNKSNYQIQVMTAGVQTVIDREQALNGSLKALCTELAAKHHALKCVESR